MDSILFEATLYLVAMVVAVPLSVRLGLGSVLGYLVAGIALAPILRQTGADPHDLQHVAEFGVVMMLFLIGLELNPKGLWEMRHKLIGQGGAQIVLSTVVIGGGALALGLTWQQSLAVGLIFALSSTAIVLQTLTEKNLLRTTGGRSAFSVLLTQDIAVIPMLALMPLLATVPTASFTEDGSILRTSAEQADTGLSLVAGLPAWAVTLITLAAVGAVIAGGRYLTRPLFQFIHMARLREMYTAVALVIVVGIAFLMVLVGLSPALGAFVAGVVLANSEFKHELEANIEPFKGLLLGLFFISVGASIHFAVLWSNLLPILGITLAVMVSKGLILYAIGRGFGLRGRDEWLFTLSLAQAGEFGFVLISFAMAQAVLPQRIADILLLVVALSMLLTPLFFILYEFLSSRTKDADEGDRPEEDEIDAPEEIIIAGTGRFGQVVNRMLQLAGFKTVVLDADLSTIQLLRRFGIHGYFGDPTRPELLHAAGIDHAKVLVVAMDGKEDVVKLVRYARNRRPDLHIVARAYDRVHTYELYQAGANDIVREMFDSSLRAGRYVLENMGLTQYEAHEMETAFYHHDRQTLRELAELWQPGTPLSENEDYVARARELNNTLETALATKVNEAELPVPVEEDDTDTGGPAPGVA
ncbi:monovalent cation:proton antiporter-2 (CPA2) family protein [Nioella nitratireducens]|uniref:monovalent cation:proton antiporter-2 (CPA2) family protein n=1 Tax=Nioella nitratireducens TaxID=1287720 RepID=UPI0008FD6CDB|nr:monovalent cation:proton antiporter-2 (CPA2) family protein [Nioella nitratireducens]